MVIIISDPKPYTVIKRNRGEKGLLIKKIPATKDMLEFGQLIGNNLRPGHLIYLVGRLGAGKTTLVQGIARV